MNALRLLHAEDDDDEEGDGDEYGVVRNGDAKGGTGALV